MAREGRVVGGGGDGADQYAGLFDAIKHRGGDNLVGGRPASRIGYGRVNLMFPAKKVRQSEGVPYAYYVPQQCHFCSSFVSLRWIGYKSQRVHFHHDVIGWGSTRGLEQRRG